MNGPAPLAIKPEQIRTIKTLSKSLGQSDEVYRGMLKDTWKVRSCTELTARQADEVIASMRRVAFTMDGKGRGPLRHEGLRGRPSDFATPGQIRLVEVLWSQVSHGQTVTARKNALDVFLRNRFTIMSLERIPFKDVPKVVSTLRAMFAQQQKKPTAASSQAGFASANLLAATLLVAFISLVVGIQIGIHHGRDLAREEISMEGCAP